MVNMVLRIAKPEIVKSAEGWRMQARVEYSEMNSAGWSNLWFEVDEQFGQYLAYERSDAFVVALLPYLLSRSKHDDPLTVVCDAPLSSRLHYQLTKHFIPSMDRYISWCDSIILACETDDSILGNPYAIASGVSGGVDSYFSLLNSVENDTDENRITHGLYCEIEDNGPSDNDVQRAYRKMVHEIGESLGIEIVEVRSNICSEIYRFIHEVNVTHVFLSQVFALQKLIKVYYYSATHEYNQFEFEDHTGDNIVLFNMYCLDNENTRFYMTGGNVTRHEKTGFIADFEAPRKHMMVCRNPTVENGKLKNCSRCSKCTRTIIDLDIYGKLDSFSEIFDIEAYRNDPDYYWGYLFWKGVKDPFIKETLEECKRRGISVPFRYRIAGLRKLISHGFKKGNPLQYDYVP